MDAARTAALCRTDNPMVETNSATLVAVNNGHGQYRVVVHADVVP